MFKTLNNNLAVSILAVVATTYVAVAIWFYSCGKKLREAGALRKRLRTGEITELIQPRMESASMVQV